MTTLTGGAPVNSRVGTWPIGYQGRLYVGNVTNVELISTPCSYILISIYRQSPVYLVVITPKYAFLKYAKYA